MNIDFIPEDWSKMHHAYIIHGLDKQTIWEQLNQRLQYQKLANPDAYEAQFETFGIDEARMLSEWALNKSLNGSEKVAVIEILSFTHEAQNALLKLFEEPPTGTYFLLIIPQTVTLLPTLLSRSRQIKFEIENKKNTSAQSFLNKNKNERLKFVSNMIKNKDTTKTLTFLRELEKNISEEKSSNQLTRIIMLEKISKAKKFISLRGGSVKMILEYLALSLPNVNL